MNNNQNNGPRLAVFSIIEVSRTQNYWHKIGAAFKNRDGSLNIVLNSLPLNGRLQVRVEEEHQEQQQGHQDNRRPQPPQAPPAQARGGQRRGAYQESRGRYQGHHAPELHREPGSDDDAHDVF